MWDFRGLDRETRTRKWREHFFPPSAHHKRSFLPSFLSISVSLRLIPLVLFLKKCWTALRKNQPNIYTIKLRPCSRVRRCQPPAWAVRWKRGLFITRSIAGAAVDAFGTTVCIMLDNAREDIPPPPVPSVQSAKCSAVLCKSGATVDAVVLRELCSAPCDKSVTSRHKSACPCLLIWKVWSCFIDSDTHLM